MGNRDTVREYYNKHAAEEDRRLDRHPFEIPVTMHFARHYLDPGACIFDAACGTGRIAEHLLDAGYRVGLNDLSDANIRLVHRRLDADPNILFVERSDAFDSPRWDHCPWDAVFLMGPLYHLISLENRLALLRRAEKALKPGGFLFASFMTRTGALVYGLKHNPEGISFPDGARKLWETGTDERFVEGTEAFIHAYFSHPEEIGPLIRNAGLEPLHLAGVEGPFGERFELYHQLDPDLKRKWMDFVIEHAEDQHMISQAKHLLSIARKKTTERPPPAR